LSVTKAFDAALALARLDLGREKSMSGAVDKQPEAWSRDKFVARYGVAPSEADHSTLLKMIEDLLNEGLKTQVEPFPETDREFAALLDLLRPMSSDQLAEKLVVSGWLLKPYGPDEMRCQECMYFLVHKRWCDLPELSLPAEPDWWCRLWRI
jgi:hypothetical protein